MKTKFAKIAGFLLIISLMSINVSSQDLSQVRNRFMGELSKTQRVLEQARSAISESNTAYDFNYLRIANRQAKQLLDMAIGLQDLAMACRSSSTMAGYKTGIMKTLEARELAWKAINIKRRAEGKVEENENTVRRQLEQVDRLIERVREQINGDSPEQLRATFENVLDSQRRAREMFRERNMRASLKLSRNAGQTLRKIADRLKEASRTNQRVQNQMARLEQKAEQMQVRLESCRNPEADKLMEKCRELLQKAARLSENGQPKQAEKAINQVRRQLQNIAEICSGQDASDKMIERLGHELERYAPKIIASGNSEAIRLLHSAREHLVDARKLCAEGSVQRCAAAVKAAQMNLRKAVRMAGL